MTKHSSVTQGSLHAQTLALLRETELSLIEVSNATGLPFYWLQKFHYTDVKDPSVNRVQLLYEFLNSKKLQV